MEDIELPEPIEKINEEVETIRVKLAPMVVEIIEEEEKMQ